MGVKAVYLICACATLGNILLVTSFFLPMHKLAFFGGGFVKVAQVNTHALWIEFPSDKQGAFCKKVFDSAEGANKKDKKSSKDVEKERSQSEGWCKNIQGSHEIQDVAMHLCTPAINFLWPQFCNGINNAYGFGVVLTIAMVGDIALQGLGCYFLYDYVTRKANPQYRTYGGTFCGVGTLLLMFSLSMYYFFVLHELSSITSGWTSLFLSTSKNDGSSHAFVMSVIAVMLHTVGLCLYPMVKRDYEEELYYDQKLAKEEAREYGAMGQGAQSAGGFGMQPAMSPAMQQPMMMQQQPMMVQQQPMIVQQQPMMVQQQPMAMQQQPMMQAPPAAMQTQFAVGAATTYDAGPMPPNELGSGPAF